MNRGAIKIFENFIGKKSIDNTLSQLETYDWKPVWSDKRYAGDYWMTCPIKEEFVNTPNYDLFPISKEIESLMKCKIKNLMFYAMLPGGDIPPHRDMVGNVGFGGLRLHIPLVTNSKVNFVVDGKKVVMGVGELWALDTSYTHSVSNLGEENRIHVVMDVIVNEWVLGLLPKKDFRFYLHQLNLMWLGFTRVFEYLTRKDLKFKDFLSVVYNSLKLKIFKK